MEKTLSSPDSRRLWAKAAELVGDDEHAIRRLLSLIAETNRTTLASLHESLGALCWQQVGSAAHRMAGSARMLDHDALITLLTELEAAARAPDTVRAAALVPVIADTLAGLDTSIEEALGFTAGRA